MQRGPHPGASLLVFLLVSSWSPLLAQPLEAQPAAIVEEVSHADPLHPLQLIRAGQRIDLGEGGRIVLGFFASCWQESIVGGQISIEARHSRALGGAMTRRRVECDSTALTRSASSGEAAARAVVPLVTGQSGTPDLLLFGRSPVILSRGSVPHVDIERLDVEEPAIRAQLVDGKADLYDRGIELDPGALYRFAVGEVSIVARVDELAEPGRAPLLGRLVMLRDQPNSQK